MRPFATGAPSYYGTGTLCTFTGHVNRKNRRNNAATPPPDAHHLVAVTRWTQHISRVHAIGTRILYNHIQSDRFDDLRHPVGRLANAVSRRRT